MGRGPLHRVEKQAGVAIFRNQWRHRRASIGNAGRADYPLGAIVDESHLHLFRATKPNRPATQYKLRSSFSGIHYIHVLQSRIHTPIMMTDGSLNASIGHGNLYPRMRKLGTLLCEKSFVFLMLASVPDWFTAAKPSCVGFVAGSFSRAPRIFVEYHCHPAARGSADAAGPGPVVDVMHLLKKAAVWKLY